MSQRLNQHIYHIGLFACIPAIDEDNLLRAVDALVLGGVYGIIFSWNKHLASAIEQIHKRHAQLLIGVQGPYEKACKLFASGIAFVVDTVPVQGKAPIPFFLRKGNELINGKTKLANCSNKLVFVNDTRRQKWDEITLRAQRAVDQLLGFELRHVGMNHLNAKEAEKTANQFERLFGFTKTDKGGAYFAGPYVECMKKMFYGKQGHIAIATACAERAAWYLEQRGAKFNWKSADYNPDGTLRVVYLQEEIGGFAVHILQK